MTLVCPGYPDDRHGEVTMRDVVVLTGSEGQVSWAQAAAFIVPVIALAGRGNNPKITLRAK